MDKQAHVYIKGEVIGVGFRAWTKIQARQLQVTGWVCNRHDLEDVFGPEGGVEAVLQGSSAALTEMLRRLEQGPAVSRVDDVEIYWEPVKQAYPGFDIVMSKKQAV